MTIGLAPVCTPLVQPLLEFGRATFLEGKNMQGTQFATAMVAGRTGGKKVLIHSFKKTVMYPAVSAFLRSLGLQAGFRLAEIGCGNCEFLHYLIGALPRPGSIFAGDFDADLIRQAKLLIAEKQVDFAGHCEPELALLDLKAPIDQRHFGFHDIITCAQVLMHLTQEQSTCAVSEMTKCLRDGGWLVATTITRNWALVNWPEVEPEKNCFSVPGNLDETDWPEFYPPDEHYVDVFRSAGLTDVQRLPPLLVPKSEKEPYCRHEGVEMWNVFVGRKTCH